MIKMKDSNWEEIKENHVMVPGVIHNFQNAFGMEKKEIIVKSDYEIKIPLKSYIGKPKEILISDMENKLITQDVLLEFAKKSLKPCSLKILVAIIQDYDKKTVGYRHPKTEVVAITNEILKNAKFEPRKKARGFAPDDRRLVEACFSALGRMWTGWVVRNWEFEEDRITRTGRRIRKGGYKSSKHELVKEPLIILRKKIKMFGKEEYVITPFDRERNLIPDKFIYELGEILWICLYGEDMKNRMLAPINTDVFYGWHAKHEAHELLLHFYYSQMFRINWKREGGVVRQRLGTILVNAGIPLGIESRHYMRVYDSVGKWHDNLVKNGAIKSWEIEEIENSGIRVFNNIMIIYPPDSIVEIFSKSERLQLPKK